MKLSAPLQIEVLRGTAIESRHLVDAVILDERGKRVRAFGNPEQAVFPRSSIKPLQALPFVLSNAWEKLEQPQQALALSCASHDGEPLHIRPLSKWRDHFGFHDSDLACGAQMPSDKATAHAMIRAGEKPCRIHNNCSGKHFGLLSTCKAHGWSIKGYEKWDHPVQKAVRKVLTEVSGIDHDKAAWGIDGCGIPAYQIPLDNVAKMFCGFHAADTSEFTQGLHLLREACAREPLLIGGTDSFCSLIGEATAGRVFAKIGAEGNYVSVLFEHGLSIALKARDGSFRACEAALTFLLAEHAALEESVQARINEAGWPQLKNWAGTVVGSIRVAQAPMA